MFFQLVEQYHQVLSDVLKTGRKISTKEAAPKKTSKARLIAEQKRNNANSAAFDPLPLRKPRRKSCLRVAAGTQRMFLNNVFYKGKTVIVLPLNLLRISI